jgi:chromosome segregation ATPase
MMNREQTVENLKRKLDYWNSEMDVLEKKAEKFEAERRKDAKQTLEELRKQRDDAARAFEKLKTASDDAFDDVRNGTQKAWDAMTASFDRAKKRYN